MAPDLVAVLIAEMHFDAGDMLRQMDERAFHRRFGLNGQFFATCDVVDCVDLDFYDFCLSSFCQFRKRSWRPSPFSWLDPLFPVEAHDFTAFETQHQLIAFKGKCRLFSFPNRLRANRIAMH